jgi:hypothetical protein
VDLRLILALCGYLYWGWVVEGVCRYDRGFIATSGGEDIHPNIEAVITTWMCYHPTIIILIFYFQRFVAVAGSPAPKRSLFVGEVDC